MNISSIYRTHSCGGLDDKNVGASVVLSGWIHRKRDHGGLLFVDLRDNYGITQCVFDLADAALLGLEKVHPESVITVRGKVVLRDASQINDKIPTGKIEVKADKFEVLTNAEALPFQVFGDEETNEELRLKYRYLAQRRERLHANIHGRNRIIRFIRDKMWDFGFSEFQTPILTVSSPEGARDYLVPSRLHHGEFYALPQAPQQFKQLLMIGGFDRYFQIAPCFRDEDLRADRLIEFYQLDIEMSFVEIPEIQKIGEELIPTLIKEFVPGAKLSPGIPHISYADSMLKYGSDKPDLRNPIEIADVSETFKNSDFAIFADAVKKGSVVRAVPAPNTADKPRSFFDKMGEFATKELGLGGLGYIIYAEEAKGPVAKKLSPEQVAAIKSATNAKTGDTVFFVADEVGAAAKAAGKLRAKLGEDLGLIDPKEFRLCWIDSFPMYEINEETGKIDFGHNPFSLPQSSLDGDPLKILANQFDMVLNGWEICSGGLRNYNPANMVRAFEIAGYTEEDVKSKFGGMWTAFQYGVPPHGGCAFGIDRLVCIILAEPNLRECVAFTTNQRGQDLMLGAPREVSEQQLREAHIQIRKKN
ncbi:MAG: aspartate--tRNA ligase [Rickettsiales bacterium]|jgi:aspartyl-tRNA synthetase|nr:aspartate--tRNA ligase [Rickettsiales bacterium]